MPPAKYIVELTTGEREKLVAMVRRGKILARSITRARILLKASQRLTDDEIASDLGIGSATVGRVRQLFVEEGLQSVLGERPRSPKDRKTGAKPQAHVIALACSPALEGGGWTLRFLADRVVELGFTEPSSHETVRLSKKQSAEPGRRPGRRYRK